DTAPYDARDLRLPRIPRRRGVDELRREQYRRRSPGWHLCWPHPQGRQAGRPAGPAGGESRADHQSDHRQGPRHYVATEAARPRGRGDRVKRRRCITLLGGAAAWPLAVRAQQPAKVPTIGFLGSGTPITAGAWVVAFAQRLRELGWIEDRTIKIDLRWAEG